MGRRHAPGISRASLFSSKGDWWQFHQNLCKAMTRNLAGRPASAPPDEGKGKAVRGVVEDLLARLPPSAELLQHYQNKLAQYEEEEAQLAARIDACAKLLDNSSR